MKKLAKTLGSIIIIAALTGALATTSKTTSNSSSNNNGYVRPRNDKDVADTISTS